MLQVELFAVGCPGCSIWDGSSRCGISRIQELLLLEGFNPFRRKHGLPTWPSTSPCSVTLPPSYSPSAPSSKYQGAGSKPLREVLSQTPGTQSPLDHPWPGPKPRAQPTLGTGTSQAAPLALHLHDICRGKQMGLHPWKAFLFNFKSLSERHNLPVGLLGILFPRKVISSHFPQSEHGQDSKKPLWINKKTSS